MSNKVERVYPKVNMIYIEVNIYHHHDLFSTMHCGDRFQVSRKGGTGGGDVRDGVMCAWW